MTAEFAPRDRAKIVTAVYSDEFLSELGAKFNFDALEPKMAREIRDIGWRYFADIAIFGEDGPRAERREDYQRLKAQIQNFLGFLGRPEYVDIASDLYFTARRMNEPAPQTDFPEISEFDKTRGAPYLAELQRLLNLLNAAAEDGIKCFSPSRGRKRNYPVENFTRRAAYIWSDLLNRPFSVDYHKGSGVSPGFEYVRLLLHRLGSEISEKTIVTAMRSHIKQRGELGLR